jgi:hypothetical protein
VGGDVVINSSARQAWRAGFREGVKLCLEGNNPVSPDKMDWRNYDRLWCWMHVGQHVDNGIWAIYGARLGAYLTQNNLHDHSKIHDFEYLNNMFDELCDQHLHQLLQECNGLGTLLSNFRVVSVMTPDESSQFISTNIPPLRSPQVFLQEPDIPQWQRVDVSNYRNLDNLTDIVGKCSTDWVWIVDEFCYEVQDFDFVHHMDFYSQPAIFEWVGVKLVPRIPVLRGYKLDTVRMTY